MDLTPPSLTTSPSSPQRKSISSPPPFTSCFPEPQTVSYSPLSFLEDSFIPPPYGSLDHCSVAQSLDMNSPLASLEPIPQDASWGTPSIAAASPATTSASLIPSVVSSDYDSFPQYEPSTLAPYSQPSFARTTSVNTHPGFMRTPPPSTDAPTRASSISTTRSQFGYGQNHQKPRLNSFAQTYSPAPEASPFPPAQRVLGGYYDMQTQQMPASHFQRPVQPSHTPAPPSQADSAQEPKSRWATNFRKKQRKTARRHTTKEEANFQCQVEGCGKFFSRSYNYKSHMETHDEKREYPFPCTVPNCSKKFVRKTDLQRHHQSVHTKERNHKCDYCGRMFARKDTLRRHMEDGCSKRFDIGMLAPTETYADMSGQRVQADHMPQMSMPLPPPTAATHAPMPTLGARVGQWSR